MDAGELRFAVGAARAADDHERDRRVVERGEAADREADALERLDATDEQDHAPTVEPEAVPRRGAIAGREHRVVDAGRDDLDAIGVGVVERRELRAFVVGRREHRGRRT